MTLNLSHFSAALLVAVAASTVFGITMRDNPKAMLKYGLYCLRWFVGGVVLAGWIMWLLRR
jgi:hypothetical protein